MKEDVDVNQQALYFYKTRQESNCVQDYLMTDGG